MSKNYLRVKKYYDNYINNKYPQWDLEKVRKAVGIWITADEYKEITGEDLEVST